MTNKKRMIENIISLFILQGGNYIIPLIIFPYLVRVLGIEGYGIIVAAAAFINYFIVFTDYGFNLIATRDISLNRNVHHQQSEIFTNVMFIKIFMMLLSFVIMLVLLFFIDAINSEWKVYFATFLMVVGSVFFPIWYFQGIERMKYITLLNLVGRIISIILIFIFVKDKNDYFIAALIQSFGTLIPGLISYYVVFKYFKVKLVKVNISNVIKQLKEGFAVFISGLSILSYTAFNTIIIGTMYGPKEAGIFSVAIKLISAVSSITQPVLQTFAPHISFKYKESIENGRSQTFKLGYYLILFNIFGACALFIFTKPIVLLIFGKLPENVIAYLRILSILPLITIIAFLTINILMLNEGIIKYSMYIYLGSGLLNIILGPIVLKLTNVSGLVVLYIFIEIMITIVAIIIYVRRRPNSEIKYSNT